MKLINLAALALVFVILYNLLLFHVSLGIGNGILFLLLSIFFFIVRNKNTKNLDFAVTGSIVTVFFAFLFSYISKSLQDKYGSGIQTWQAFNLSEYFAYQHIRDNKETFDLVPKLLEQANQIDQKVSTEVRNATQFDRSMDAPLTRN